MKKLFYFMSLACIMMFAACSSDDDNFTEENNKQEGLEKITITAGMPGADGTRVEMNTLTNMVWSAGDFLYVFGEPRGWGRQYFSMQSDPGSKSAKFTGNVSSKWTKCWASYVVKGGKVSYNPENGLPTNCKYNEQVQDGINNFAHIKNHLLLTSDKMTVAELKKGILLKPNNAILEVNVKNLPTELSNLNATSYLVKFFINGNQKAQLTLNNGQIVNKQNNKLYIAFDPKEALSANGEIAFEFSSGNVVKRASAISNNGKTYVAGKIYTLGINNASEKDGSLYWESSSITDEVVYSNAFSTNDFTGWTQEGDMTSQLISFNETHNSMQISGTTKNACDGFYPDSYIISPEMDLKPNANKVSFMHAYKKISAFPGFTENFVIRVINGTKRGSWEKLSLKLVSNDTFILSETDLAKYNGKKVQLAFRYRFPSNDNVPGEWYIKDFKVVGH